MRFENQVVLITGGGSGIGRASALAFAQEGAAVMIADVNTDGGHETVTAVTSAGGTAHFTPCDVTQADQVQALIDGTRSRFGRLDIAVNNAGIGGQWVPLVDTDEALYTSIMDVNVKGVWLCMRAQIPVMIGQGGGVIINTASVAGLIGAPNGSIYSASKHAVIGLTRSAALEVARKGVRVNAICPSYIDTPMVTEVSEGNERLQNIVHVASPMRRMGTVEEVATAVLWLADPSASFVNGIVLPIDGGLTAS